MIKVVFIFIVIFFLNNCSFNENSKIWKNNKDKLNLNKKVKKVSLEDKNVVTEFNKGLKLDLSSIKIKENKINNKNNFGSQNYEGQFT